MPRIAIIEDKRAEIEALCRRYGIRRLEVFGSAANGRFDPKMSDLDSIVDVGEYEAGISHRFLGFADALETLFGRKIDVIVDGSIRNQVFSRS